MPSYQDRVMGGMLGVLVGDMLGVPYEQTAPRAMPRLPADLLTLPNGFVRAHPEQPLGVYSDDGAQSLCLLSSLLGCNGWNADDFGRQLLRWLDAGHLAARGGIFGTGGTTRTALGRIREGTPALLAGLTEETALGNGPLMRGLPLALWGHDLTDTELVRIAMDQCRVTHAHPRALATTAVHALYARCLLEDVAPVDALNLAIDAAHRRLHGDLAREVWALRTRTRNAAPPTGDFHIVETFHSAVAASGLGSFEETIRAAIELGNDTDTTASVAGGLAGIRFGMGAIPRRWIDVCLESANPQANDLLLRLDAHALCSRSAR